MSLTSDQIKKLEFHSDFAIDKVVFSQSGSFTFSGTTTDSDTVTHNYGRLVYPLVIWTPDDSQYFTSGDQWVQNFGTSFVDYVTINPRNSANSCKVELYSINAPSNTTVSYTLYLIERDT